MKKELTELIFILDKSGSMAGLESDTIGGYNSFLEKQKEVEGDCLITTVLFDHSYELLHDRVDIKDVVALTDKDYRVRGSTALYDALGRTILKTNDAKEKNTKVLFVIITDGQENSSKEFTSKKVKLMVEEKIKEGFEFVFLGANIDAAESASRVGIKEDKAIDYISDSQGIKLNYDVMSKAVKDFRTYGAIDSSNFDDIKEDVKRRKKED